MSIPLPGTIHISISISICLRQYKFLLLSIHYLSSITCISLPSLIHLYISIYLFICLRQYIFILLCIHCQSSIMYISLSPAAYIILSLSKDCQFIFLLISINCITYHVCLSGSVSSKCVVDSLLQQVSQLSDVEKFLLYLKLPVGRPPDTDPLKQ